MALVDRVLAGVREREQEAKDLHGNVLVFGPGGEAGKRKRRIITSRLKRLGFEAHTSERLSRRRRSSLTAVQQEDEHWRHFDIVLVLCFSEGPRLELALYQHHNEFRQKARLFYPEDVDPITAPGTMASEVIRNYPNRMRVSHDEYNRCAVTSACVDEAVAVRSAYADSFRTS